MDFVLSHIGLCVSDLDEATRFYCDGLGFEVQDRVEVDTDNPMFELGQVRFCSTYIRKGGLTIELLSFDGPHHEPSNGVRPLNRPGFTHLSLEVDDIDAVRERVLAFGGTARDESRFGVDQPERVTKATEVPTTSVLMCLDPDGNRVELIKSAGSPVDNVGERMCWQ